MYRRFMDASSFNKEQLKNAHTLEDLVKIKIKTVNNDQIVQEEGYEEQSHFQSHLSGQSKKNPFQNQLNLFMKESEKQARDIGQAGMD